jgi:translation initiation factor 2 subunit 2
MSLISINSKFRQDPYHRYKMQPVLIKTVNRGQYGTTTILNMKEISNSLHHPEEILFKFISYDLATSCDVKRGTITGAYTINIVQDSIDKYINNFILCVTCSVPEIDPELEGKKKKIKCNMHCAACGSTNKLTSADKAVDKTIKLIIKELQSNREWRKHSKNYDEVELCDDFDNFGF